MNRRFPRALCAAVFALGLAAAPAAAQLEENISSLTGDQTEGYLGPIAKGISATLNSGIFRSGEVPLLGLTLTLDVKAVWVSFSDDDRVYTTPDVPGFGSTSAATVIGDTLATSLSGPGGAELVYPGGFDMENFGIAVPQVTIGNILGTRAMVRYISLNLGDGDQDLGDFSLFGIGGQHSISRYFPGLPIDVAAGVMWQTFSISDDLVTANALALNLTGSRKFGAIITIEPYVGIGLDSFSMDAEYTDDATGQTISVEFDRSNDLHLTVGASLNIPIVKIHAELNRAAVNGIAGGVSFGI